MPSHNRDRNRGMQDRLNRVAKRLGMKFGTGLYTEGSINGGVPVDMLVKRVANKKIVLDSVGSENPSGIRFTTINNALGNTYPTEEQVIASQYLSANLPSGFYGSVTPLVMLARLKAGLDSIDIHVLGDSNTGHNSTTPNPNPDVFVVNGWAGGLAKGLIRGACAGMYATPISPTLVHPSAFDGGNGNSYSSALYNSFFCFSNASPFNGITSEIWSNGATLQSGTYYAPSDVKQYFDTKTSAVMKMLGSYAADFAWMATKGVSFTRSLENNTANYISAYYPGRENNAFDTRGALTYRVVHSVLPNSGSFPMHIYAVTAAAGSSWADCQVGVGLNGKTYGLGANVYSWAPVSGQSTTNYANGGFKRISVAGATGITASSHTWAADSTRVGVTIGWNWYGHGSALSGNTWAEGPIAVYLDSLHGNTKGWAITNLNYASGGTTGYVSLSLGQVSTPQGSSSPSALRTILNETRERQIQAGGSGNVLVFIQTGVNDATSGLDADYLPSIRSIIANYKNTWESLSYPENDLAFIIAVTHPTTATDSNLSAYRAAGKTIYRDGDPLSSNVTFVDVTQLGANGITFGGLTTGNAFSNSTSFYTSTSDSVHLKSGLSGGYAYLGELLVTRALRYSTNY